IDREQDDEGCRHIERRREDSLECQAALANDPGEREAAMVEWLRHPGPEMAVEKEPQGDRRQVPADGAPRGFENENYQRAAQRQLLGRRPGRTDLVVLDIERQVERR